MLKLLIACAAVLLLSGCGKDGGNNNQPPAPPPPPVPVEPIPALPPNRKGKLFFSYFGGTQDEIFSHENMVFATTWNNPDPGSLWMIDILTRAKNAGVENAILAIDHLLFSSVPGHATRFYGGYDTIAPKLRELFNNLRSVGLLSMVRAVYPIDEPERESNVGAGALSIMCSDVRTVAAEFSELSALKIGIIYGDGGDYRALDKFDWVGIDAYQDGAGILQGRYAQLLSLLQPNQSLILVPGGADPWRADPLPFYSYAIQEERVVLICPFIWTDNWGGSGNKGIAGNGLAPLYNSVADAIRV